MGTSYELYNIHMKTILPRTLKGFRDFLPEDMKKRNYVSKKVIETFQRYGFEPLETHTLEYASLLLGKYGDEADKLVYSFKDRGDRELALRYDQTVPTARVLAQYQNVLPKYFRRYQIQNVFRADKPQKGRYREFTQCDIDIFNSTSPLADAEILAATYFAYKNVGYKEVVLQINHRAILFAMLEPYATSQVGVMSLIQSIDKLDKIGKGGVSDELQRKGLDKVQADTVVERIENTPNSNENLLSIIQYAVDLGIPKSALKFTPHLARGLDYYTGMIFEVSLPGYTVGSCGGGGRYDKLIEQLGGVSIPAVGIAFGFDRMVEAADFFDIFPDELLSQTILMTIFDESTCKASLNLASTLRMKGINIEVYPDLHKLEKQLKFANNKSFMYVIILGPEEIQHNKLRLKNMQTGEQTELTTEDLILKLKNAD